MLIATGIEPSNYQMKALKSATNCTKHTNKIIVVSSCFSNQTATIPKYLIFIYSPFHSSLQFQHLGLSRFRGNRVNFLFYFRTKTVKQFELAVLMVSKTETVTQISRSINLNVFADNMKRNSDIQNTSLSKRGCEWDKIHPAMCD